MKHNADTLRNVILSCDSIRDARNLNHVSSDCCYRASRASLTAREAPCTHVCHMRVHSAKHRVPTALIIMKGPGVWLIINKRTHTHTAVSSYH